MKKGLRTVWRVLLTIFSILLLVGILLTIFFTFYLIRYVDSDVEEILTLAGENGTPSRLYALNSAGELVEYAAGEISSGYSNDYAVLEEIPEHLQNAFIAIEDKRFYTHIGFDPITTVKAAFKYVFSSGSSPGGSTITQQLIKNITGEDDISIKRKLTEIMRAVKLEKELSKEDILELYLNSIYLSQGAYGVKAAAHLYFNKELSELTPIESAAIAAITQAPTKWDPIQNPDNNKIRRDIILTEMYEQGYLTEEEYSESYNQPLLLDVNYEKVVNTTSSWYTDAVLNEAIRLLEETLNVSKTVAARHLYNGGYRILVSLNPEVQEILEKYYADSTYFSTKGAQSSFVVLDPTDGSILGLVGGLGEKTASRLLNRATQTTRSPGSSIKPLSVYLPALERGLIDYGSAFKDAPLYFGGQYPATGWPKNASGTYVGQVSLRYAISRSLNTVAVKVLEEVGVENAYAFLSESLGISTLVADGERNDKNLSALALGGMTKGVTLTELVSAYTPLANDGVYTGARCVLKILDRSGKTVVDNTAESRVVIREETSQVMTKLLTNVLTASGGTAYGAVTKLSAKCDVAGKTGTTSDNNDRWFVGYTPYCIGGIWLGYDTPASLSGIESKKHIRLWDSIMSEVHDVIGKDREKNFDFGLLVEARYCVDSGKAATDACYSDARGNRTEIGYFTKDTVPTEKCDKHGQATLGTSGTSVNAFSVNTVGVNAFSGETNIAEIFPNVRSFVVLNEACLPYESLSSIRLYFNGGPISPTKCTVRRDKAESRDSFRSLRPPSSA